MTNDIDVVKGYNVGDEGDREACTIMEENVVLWRVQRIKVGSQKG